MPSPYELRPLRVDEPAELAAVLSLNNAAVPAVSSLTEPRLRHLADIAEHAEVVVTDAGRLAGFVVVLPAGAPYDSELFGWFARRYDQYLYLDRIVVHPDFHRQGVGRLVYDQMERRAQPAERLLCEVNLDPPNPDSQAFHTARGFVEVGRVRLPGDADTGSVAKQCQMLVKDCR